jgi:uncharacterized membrane protein YpjA
MPYTIYPYLYYCLLIHIHTYTHTHIHLGDAPTANELGGGLFIVAACVALNLPQQMLPEFMKDAQSTAK